MSLLVCLIISLIVGAAVVMVIHALLQLPGLGTFAPFGNLIAVLVVLLIVLVILVNCFGGMHAFRLNGL